MEHYDPEAAQRVWQRVRGDQTAAQQPQEEQTLLMLEAETAEILSVLLQNFPGNGALLRPVILQTRRHMACLQGIRQLRLGSKAKLPGRKGTVKSREGALRRCYVNCMNTAAQYEARKDDPEYGCVFLEMAAAKRRHCAVLLELLGSGK